MPPRPGRPVVRLLSRVKTKRGCWEWQGPVFQGYGYMGPRMTHRLAYEMLVGPIPDGLQLDHLCRNRLCCNPDHLEPVTSRENTMRGLNQTAVNAAKTRCVNGHEFTIENTYWRKNGQRDCRRCKADRERERRRKREDAQ